MPRKSNYDSKIHDRIVWALAVEGKTDAEIAGILGVTERTLNYWKKNYDTFFQSLKEGKEIADADVVKSLYRRAVGNTVIKDKKVIVEMDAEGNQRPVRIETTEHPLPPDVTAAIFWLKNRKPEQWRDRQDVKVENNEWVKALQSTISEYRGEHADTSEQGLGKRGC